MARIAVADGDASTAEIAAFERDRRALLRRGLAFGGAALAASAIPLLWSVRTAFADSKADAAILEKAIALEHVAVLAYQTAIDSGLLSAAVLRIVRRVRAHEQEHAEALTTALTNLGSGTPPPPPQGIADVDKVVKGLGGVRSQSDIVTFAIELEMATVAAYFDAHAKLAEPRLLQSAASIMACEGQHLVALRRAAGKNPVPFALETGTA
jgi:ferritin-like protein